MSYLFKLSRFIVVRKSDRLIKFLNQKKEYYLIEERNVSHCGVCDTKGVISYKGVLYGEDIFLDLYPFDN